MGYPAAADSGLEGDIIGTPSDQINFVIGDTQFLAEYLLQHGIKSGANFGQGREQGHRPVAGHGNLGGGCAGAHVPLTDGHPLADFLGALGSLACIKVA